MAATGFRANANWHSASTVGSADVVQVWDGVTWLGFYHNGTSWRQVGAPGGKDGLVLLPGQPLLIARKSTPPPNAAFITQPLNFIP